DDCDEALREAIVRQKDVELVDEDYDDVVDVVLLWWRDGDGDLFDALADALTPLADGGYIWLLTPKPGRENYVEPSEIGEVAPTAGLSQTSSLSAGRDWLGTRLVAPRARRGEAGHGGTRRVLTVGRMWVPDGLRYRRGDARAAVTSRSGKGLARVVRPRWHTGHVGRARHAPAGPVGGPPWRKGPGKWRLRWAR